MPAWRGSESPRVLLLGEAWGEQEEIWGTPFVGASGQELWRMLGQAWGQDQDHLDAQRDFHRGPWWESPSAGRWLERQGAAMTNVLNLRPPQNNLAELCQPEQSSFRGVKLAPLGRGGAGFPKGVWLAQDLAQRELTRLQEELLGARDRGLNLVVVLGNTALWALTGHQNISSTRGAVAQATLLAPGLKFLPTYHPAGVLRQWSWRPTVVMDLIKAKREAEFPELRRPERVALISPSIEEVERRVQGLLSSPPPVLSADIETRHQQITMVSLAWSHQDALVVPFAVPETMAAYWPAELEPRAWRALKRVLESPIPKLGQNFIYDLQYLWKMGIRPRNCIHDLMLLHHSIAPELQKGLGFLGSIYTDEASWKLMRRKRPDTEKRDE